MIASSSDGFPEDPYFSSADAADEETHSRRAFHVTVNPIGYDRLLDVAVFGCAHLRHGGVRRSVATEDEVPGEIAVGSSHVSQR